MHGIYIRTTLTLLGLLFVKDTNGVSTSRLQIHIPKSLSKPDGYDHRDALFGIPPYGTSIIQQLIYTNSDLCGSDPQTDKWLPQQKTPVWASPFILMVDRGGGCTFVQKARNAQHAGAAAVLIADNACQCSSEECKPDKPNEPCEATEPFMADDGSGSDITIPAFLVFKQDADPIKEVIKNGQAVRAEMSFAVPAPDARVEYELWTTPTDVYSKALEQDFKSAAVALGDRAFFTPRMFIYDGIRAGCDENGVNECYNLCTNSGRYCATDPDDDLDAGISGADVVGESLRRICIWNSYGSDGIGREYWNYVDEFMYRCGDPNKPELFTNDDCIADAMTHAGVERNLIDGCIENSGGLEGDVQNSVLEEELAAKDGGGVILIPTLLVNKAPVRGQLSFATAFKAICAGYAKGSEPNVCSQCANCVDESGCVKQGKCTAGYSNYGGSSGVSVSTFAVTLVGVTVAFAVIGLIVHRRQQHQMQEQVRGIIAQYMPLESNQAQQRDTSIGIEETDHEFS